MKNILLLATGLILAITTMNTQATSAAAIFCRDHTIQFQNHTSKARTYHYVTRTFGKIGQYGTGAFGKASPFISETVKVPAGGRVNVPITGACLVSVSTACQDNMPDSLETKYSLGDIDQTFYVRNLEYDGVYKLEVNPGL